LAVMAYRAAEKAGKRFPEADASAFGDDESIADYAKTAVYAMKKAGIINGVDKKNFAPGASATRAEAAKIVHLLMEL